MKKFQHSNLIIKSGLYFAFVTRHPLTSQYSSSGVIESLNDLYLDLKST